MKTHMADLANEVAAKSKEIQPLKSDSKEDFERIRSYIQNPVDILKKARLLENNLKMDGFMSAPIVVAILVDFNRTMQRTFAKMRKLLLNVAPEPIRRADLAPRVTPIQTP